MVINKNIIKYLIDLRENNGRNWFLENKERFNEIQKELVILTGYFLSEIEKFDKNVKGVDPKVLYISDL